MEKHIKHRILGILVIFGLIVILLPLFRSSKELAPETASVISPPFPDQSAMQLETASSPTSATNEATLVPPVMTVEPNAISPSAPQVTSQVISHVPSEPIVKNSQPPIIAKPSVKAPQKNIMNSKELIALKNSAWVVQVGSFKSKANALKTVNQLRANGYHAFIQHISTSIGDSTRVFVGPEKNKQMARSLADRLQAEMHLHGLVMSYQPLSI